MGEKAFMASNSADAGDRSKSEEFLASLKQVLVFHLVNFLIANL